MNNYSQQYLKVAATKPEHIMRKAEFDVAVESIHDELEKLSGQIEHDGPAVLLPDFMPEVMETSDAITSPQTQSISDSARLLDGSETRFPKMEIGNLPAAEMVLNDSTVSPTMIPVGEIALMETETNGVNPAVHVQNPIENIAASDTVTPKLNGERIMEQQHMQGEIEVIVESNTGEIKSQQKITNAITDGFLRYVLYDMVNGGTLSSVLRSNTRSKYNLLSRTVPSALGIYAMDRNIDIRDDTFLPPYVCGNLNTLDSGVEFYNVGGSTAEDSQVMIPMDQRCYFDHNRREMVVEYIKNTGSGTVKSVCVGRSHLLKNQMYSVAMTETAVSNQWTSTTANYLVEHHPTNGTSIWKTVAAASQYRFNLKNRTTDHFSNSALHSNIGNATIAGGIVVGNHVFKAIKQAASGSEYTIRLHYIANFRTSSTAAYKDIVVSAREGVSVNTDTIPVLVYRMDTENLEIFLSLSAGDHDDSFGYNIHKVTVSGLSTPATMTTETDDLGILPYNISNINTTAALYLTGYFDGTHYYLPYTTTIDADGKTNTIADNAFQNGIVVSADCKNVSRIFNMRNSASTPNLIVRADTGLLQCQANTTNIPYIFMSQVVSGANLPEPSVKGLDDVLRIIYFYCIN